MIEKHEIPNGSKLYFGKSAKLKREVEHKASLFLEKEGFEEIITPHFFISENIKNEPEIIHTKVQNNKFLSLRPDSTIEVLRLVLNKIDNKIQKWFYVQPVFLYPSNEHYQIGIEYINFTKMSYVLDVFTSLIMPYKIDYTLQISNIKIANLLIEKYSIDKELLSPINLEELLKNDLKWIKSLIQIHKIKDLEDVSMYPLDIQNELIHIKTSIQSLHKNNANIIIESLYYGDMKYYKSLYFRAFNNNILLAKGGIYTDSGVTSSGFAIYTDCLIDKLIQKGH